MRTTAAAILATAFPAQALDNGAALTPPMGWSTWNAFHCHITHDILVEVADAMKSSGMVDAGYASLNIDDCWPLKQRNDAGDIVPDPSKFPGGMAAFSKDIKQRGLGLGIYTAHGALTCQRYPGSLGHEKQDAEAYKSWGVVFVKNDWCWHNEPDATKHSDAFGAMRDALNATGIHMVHSVHWNYNDVPGPGCAKGADCPVPQFANMWRVGGDIGPKWNSVLRLIDTDQPHAAVAGPGSWNDADMLEVGNGMSAAQDRAHFTMWCILSSPLIAGNDVRKMSNTTRDILTNKLAIAVNQDPLGKQATVVQNVTSGDSSWQVWAKPLAEPKGSFAIAFLNRGANRPTGALDFSNLGNGAAASYSVQDLWQEGKSMGTHSTRLSVVLDATSAEFYKLTPA